MSGLEQRVLGFARSNGLHYIGSAAASLQSPVTAYGYLEQLIQQESPRHPDRMLSILEIGSWAGASTLCLGEALRRFHGGRGQILCVDPFVPYFGPEAIRSPDRPEVQAHFSTMQNLLDNQDIVGLFEHNVASAGLTNLVTHLRATSAASLVGLDPGSFDVIFVDGDQRYTPYAADLRRSLELVRNGGVVCGLGLEVPLERADVPHARANAEALFATEPDSGQDYHPGVTCAVADVLGDVPSHEGFWAVRRTSSGVDPLYLGGATGDASILQIPASWPEDARQRLRLLLSQRAGGGGLPRADGLQIAQDLREGMDRIQKDPYLHWLTRVTGGWLTPGDGNLVAFDFAISHMPEGGAVLEIGSFLGMSLCAMSYLMWRHGRTQPLFSCDPWDFEGTAEPIGGFFDASRQDYRQYCVDIFKRNIQLFAGHHLPHSVEDYSLPFLARWARGEEVRDVLGNQVKLGGPLAFVYIDGAHTYEAASGDFRGADPFVLPGGYVFFDDTSEGWGEEMARVVQEVLDHPEYELIARTPNYFFRKRFNARFPR